MKKTELIAKSFINGGGVFAYVLAITLVLSNAENFFQIPEEEAKIIVPIFMLLLFVFSASFTGFLVLGKPILLYMDGLKTEAIKLFFATLGWLILFILLVAIFLILS